MSIVVFTWDMFKLHDGAIGVGHAALSLNGPAGNIYISFWPSKHALGAAIYSQGKVHFINEDKRVDGMPSWASKPIQNLDEKKIIEWWKATSPNASIDFKKPTPFMKTGVAEAAKGKIYNIVANQCSTTIVGALMAGASPSLRGKMMAYLALNYGSGAGIASLPTITPKDVRNLVTHVWGDI